MGGGGVGRSFSALWPPVSVGRPPVGVGRPPVGVGRPPVGVGRPPALTRRKSDPL